MARLRIYTVHINPSEAHPYEQAKFVKEGFSWSAFFFSGLWALYHRLWWPAAAMFFYNFIAFQMLSSHMLSHLGLSIVDISVRLFIGFEANEWLRARLKARGYLTADIASGDSQLRAEQRYFDRYFAAHPDAVSG